MSDHDSADAISSGNLSDIASALRRIRKSQGLSRDALATMAGVSVSAIRRIEDSGDGRLSTLTAIVRATHTRLRGLAERGLGHDYARRVQIMREQRGLTISDLSERCGLSRDAIRRMESGQGNVSTLATAMVAMGRRLHVSGATGRTWDAEPARTRDVRYTPTNILDPVRSVLGRIDLDPCWGEGCITDPVRRYTEADDGLSKPWDADFVFCNPPYSQSTRWARKCRDEHSSGRAIKVVLLVKDNTYGELFQEVADQAACLIMRSRVRFLDSQGELMPYCLPTGSMFVCWGLHFREVGRLSDLLNARLIGPSMTFKVRK